MSACPTLETERLVLRPFGESDVDAYTEIVRSEVVRASMHYPPDIGRFEAWSQMAGWLGQWELRGTGQWALEEKDGGAFVGRAGLHRPERHDWPGVEVGWLLDPGRWGRGYATEAGARSIRYAFEELGLAAVFSVILPENHRSMAVARRLGFGLVEERVISHLPTMAHGIWRLGREEWRSQLTPPVSPPAPSKISLQVPHTG